MNADVAKTIADYTLGDNERESVTTRRVIAAIPAGQESYTPDARSMTALNLAWHIADEIKGYLRQRGYDGPIIDIISPDDFLEQK